MHWRGRPARRSHRPLGVPRERLTATTWPMSHQKDPPTTPREHPHADWPRGNRGGGAWYSPVPPPATTTIHFGPPPAYPLSEHGSEGGGASGLTTPPPRPTRRRTLPARPQGVLWRGRLALARATSGHDNRTFWSPPPPPTPSQSMDRGGGGLPWGPPNLTPRGAPPSKPAPWGHGGAGASPACGQGAGRVGSDRFRAAGSLPPRPRQRHHHPALHQGPPPPAASTSLLAHTHPLHLFPRPPPSLSRPTTPRRLQPRAPRHARVWRRPRPIPSWR